MSENVEQKVINIVADTLGTEREKISPETEFVNDLGADSLDLVELMMAIEAAFDCDIPDEEAGKITSVKDAIQYVEKHINS